MYETFSAWCKKASEQGVTDIALVLHTSCVNYPGEILNQMAKLPAQWILPESVYYELSLLRDSPRFGRPADLILRQVLKHRDRSRAYLRKNWDLEQFYTSCASPLSPAQVFTGVMVFWFGDLNKQDEFLWNVRPMKNQYILFTEQWTCHRDKGSVRSVNSCRERICRCSQPLSPGVPAADVASLTVCDKPGARSYPGTALSRTDMHGTYANIYESERYPGKLIKIYKNRAVTGNHVRKLTMLSELCHRYGFQELALPDRLLSVEGRNVVGYTMNKCGGKSIRLAWKTGWKGHDLDRVFRNLLMLLLELHTMRVLVNDLSFNNVLVDRDDRVYLVDCDSFQVFHYPGGGITDIYRHPGVQPECASFALREPRHEYFALAVLLFQCLFYDDPLRQVQEADDERVLDWNNAVFPLDVREGRTDLPKPNAAMLSAWKNQPAAIQRMFADEFHFRRDYSIGAWIKVLGLL